ncbi:MAG: 3-dehydroquinate synthase [Bacteroidales bacterium]|nr:3-dehydroquinate synthase [Bacteroidales bacterium]
MASLRILAQDQAALQEHLHNLLTPYDSVQIFVLCDENSRRHCLPTLASLHPAFCQEARMVCLPAGDEHKNIASLSQVWQALSEGGATRKALLINVGGGMISDLGGFAAATFKRGIDFINIPTTLLSCVDAALGGKTGINFNGLKNEVGAFYPAKAVVIHTPFFQTLDYANRCSGYGEMLKHGLLSSKEHWNEVLSLDVNDCQSEAFGQAVLHSMMVKEQIVQEDPKEQGLRKALNVGHTFAHAFESLSHRRQEPVLHGHAVAWGLICELYLSAKRLHFPHARLQEAIYCIKELYSAFHFTCDDYPFLIEAMHHDKKNSDHNIRFALLSDVGKIHLDESADEKLIEESLDFYRDVFGI